MPSPHVSPVSLSSLRVSWETPQDKDVRGEVTEYRVNLHQEQMSNPYAPPIVTQVFISAHSTFFIFLFFDRKEPLPVYSDVLLAHSFEASVAILSCTLLHPSHRTLPVAPVFQFFLLLSLICVAVLIKKAASFHCKNMAVTFISVQFYISKACALCPSMHVAWAELSKKVSSITHVNLCVFFSSFG